jgi:hypothetical protein
MPPQQTRGRRGSGVLYAEQLADGRPRLRGHSPKFTGSDPAGSHIPGAVREVGKLVIAVDNVGPFFGSMQFLYFGKRPLIEDNSVQSDHTMTVNGQIGFKIDKKLRIAVQVFNLLDTKAHAIDYFYTSRLPGEPAAGVADRRFHPIESRSCRVNLVANF